jgi:hypothetical protein
MKRLALIAALSLAGCGSPLHMQYDHGRASNAAFNAQADRTRPTVASAAYPLTGTEALEIRARVFEQSTDTETGKAEYVQVIGVE